MHSKQALTGLKILVAEDLSELRRELRALLQIAGASVEAVENGAQACKLAARTRFDAILLDLQMPVQDGFSAAREIRSLGFTGPLVAISAHRASRDSDEVKRSGFDHFFKKPLDFRALEIFLRSKIASSA